MARGRCHRSNILKHYLSILFWLQPCINIAKEPRIRPTLILRFGPPAGPTVLLCPALLFSVAPAGAKPSTAPFAARLGERRPVLPKTGDQKAGSGIRSSGLNS